MKLNFGKKLALFLHWLFSLVGCALAAVLVFIPEKFNGWWLAFDQMIGGFGDIVAIAGAALYVIFAVLSVTIIFSGKKNRGERGFITVDSSEAGRTRIALSAIDQMIRQAVRGVEGVTDMKAGIVNDEDSISINVAVSIAGGAHVPTVTMNLQRAIRSYIELNCGVAVREVCVSVNALQTTDDNGKGRRKNTSESSAPAHAMPVPAAIEPAAEPAPEPAAEPVTAESCEPVIEIVPEADSETDSEQPLADE